VKESQQKKEKVNTKSEEKSVKKVRESDCKKESDKNKESDKKVIKGK
jgi:hypothetical protein